MPRTCTICEHPDLAAINRALRNGGTLRDIARQFKVSKDALSRHKKHIPITLQDVSKTATTTLEPRQIATVQDQLQALTDRAHTITDQAEAAGDLRTAIQGIRELRGCIDLLARLTGELQSGATVNIALVNSPEWIALRDAILQALQPHPAALAAVLDALETVPGAQALPPPVQITTGIPVKRNGISPVKLSDRMSGGGPGP